MKRAGYYFIEGMPKGGLDHDAQPGIAEPESWTPYKVWAGDLWECPGCEAQLITGVAGAPWSEHYKPEFAAVVKQFKADQFQVNDC